MYRQDKFLATVPLVTEANMIEKHKILNDRQILNCFLSNFIAFSINGFARLILQQSAFLSVLNLYTWVWLWLVQLTVSLFCYI